LTTIDLLTEPWAEAIGLPPDGPRVVALGGGHGLARALTAAAGYAGAITAVVSVADDGGSSGRLAAGLGIPPPGDCRRALLALSPEASPWRAAVAHRFASGDVAGHCLGNLLLAALAVDGGLEKALGVLGRLLGARGRVVPAADAPLTLRARVDGREVRGQVAVSLSRGEVEAVGVEPAGVPASPTALEALAEADQVVVGPGSLFTSLAAVLVVPGMAAAVNASPGRLVYVANLTTQDGETLGMDGAAHVRALSATTGMRFPDVVVVNDAPFRVPAAVEAVRGGEEIIALGARLEGAALADAAAEWPRHDAARLGAVLRRLA